MTEVSQVRCNGDCSCTGMWTQYAQFSCFWEEIGNLDHWIWNCWQLVTFLKKPLQVEQNMSVDWILPHDSGWWPLIYKMGRTYKTAVLVIYSLRLTCYLCPPRPLSPSYRGCPECLTNGWEKPCFTFHFLPDRRYASGQFWPYLTGSPCNIVLGINSESPEGEGALAELRYIGHLIIRFGRIVQSCSVRASAFFLVWLSLFSTLCVNFLSPVSFLVQ